MRKSERKKLKEELRYCEIFGHSVMMGQCVVCKLSISKIIKEQFKK